MYLFLRAVHVLFGALWVGIAVFSALFLTPLAADLGSDAGKMAASLRRRGFIAFMPIIATLTILSGLYLYWRFTDGFSPEGSRTHAGMAYGTGGMLAILAFIIGASLISRSMVKSTQLATQAGTVTDATERARLIADATKLRNRAAVATRLVAILLVVTIVLMSIGLYL